MEIAEIPITKPLSSRAHFGFGGPRYWVGDIECDRETWKRNNWWPGNPIYNALLNELGACSNCGCTDCGCCLGCGELDADLDPRGHGHGPGGCC